MKSELHVLSFLTNSDVTVVIKKKHLTRWIFQLLVLTYNLITPRGFT